MSAVTEKYNPINEDIANPLNAGCPSNVGSPVCLLPPGTLPDVAKVTPAIRVATTEHEFAVLFNHLTLFCRSSLCCSLNIFGGKFMSG